MRFLLIHSPLVSKETWIALILSLDAAGFQTTVVTLDNEAAPDAKLFEHHLAQIEDALVPLTEAEIVAVAHSGAGNLLALMDPSRFAGHVFLDAIFPVEPASRFDLFDDPASVESWREIARQHGGVLPSSMLARFGELVTDDDLRRSFLAGIDDVPIQLFEEEIPVHPNWPSVRRGLYVQWTDSYAADAARADQAGFEVRRESASHFKMLNQPDAVAQELVRFARRQE